MPTARFLSARAFKPEYLTLKFANRHGLVTGATGTGKTVTLQVLAEGLSRAGVPVFAADIKGDLSGIAAAGEKKDFILARAKDVGIEYKPDAIPGHLLGSVRRAGPSDPRHRLGDGPAVFARMMELNDTQEGVLNIAFRIADEQGLLLLDLKDLHSLLAFVAENAADAHDQYGNVSAATIGTIQRAASRSRKPRRGQIPRRARARHQRLDAYRPRRARLHQHPCRRQVDAKSAALRDVSAVDPVRVVRATSRIGDPDKPKLVFFFDEAHLLFDEAPKALLEKIEQVVRLIRSKGVGVYFVTQNPIDVPETVLAQLGNRVQHALRAYTPREQKAVKAAASTLSAQSQDQYRAGHHRARQRRGSGLLPGRKRRARNGAAYADPAAFARMGPVTAAERKAVISASPVKGRYDSTIDRESAYEILQKRAAAKTATDEATAG